MTFAPTAFSQANLRPDIPAPGKEDPTLVAMASAQAETSPSCVSCHPLASLVNQRRSGYYHFEQVHAAVLADQSQCARCHHEVSSSPSLPPHRIDRAVQASTCAFCHNAAD